MKPGSIAVRNVERELRGGTATVDLAENPDPITHKLNSRFLSVSRTFSQSYLSTRQP